MIIEGNRCEWRECSRRVAARGAEVLRADSSFGTARRHEQPTGQGQGGSVLLRHPSSHPASRAVAAIAVTCSAPKVLHPEFRIGTGPWCQSSTARGSRTDNARAAASSGVVGATLKTCLTSCSLVPASSSTSNANRSVAPRPSASSKCLLIERWTAQLANVRACPTRQTAARFGDALPPPRPTRGL